MKGDHDDGRVGALYVVATPIGNLEDVTLRALRVLREADIVAAEDTRVVSHLLSHHQLPVRAVSLHQHNERAMSERVLGWLREGKRVALVTDAGTPGISDPGALVVRTVLDAGLRVVPIPGPSALAAALSVSGITEDRIVFSGFLPSAHAARRTAIQSLAGERGALVFCEAPHRVIECVRDLAGILGDRSIVIARELTKLFESIHRCALADAADWLAADPNRVRGEFVLIVTGAQPTPASEEWKALLDVLLSELPLAQAVRLTCTATGARRKAVYEHALARRDAGGL